jgi:hypothetical protein
MPADLTQPLKSHAATGVFALLIVRVPNHAGAMRARITFVNATG